MQMSLFIFFSLLLWFDLADWLSQRMWYLMDMVETISPTFINDPMFTFRLANALFLEATDVVFLDELFFSYRCSSMLLH